MTSGAVFIQGGFSSLRERKKYVLCVKGIKDNESEHL